MDSVIVSLITSAGVTFASLAFCFYQFGYKHDNE